MKKIIFWILKRWCGVLALCDKDKNGEVILQIIFDVKTGKFKSWKVN